MALKLRQFGIEKLKTLQYHLNDEYHEWLILYRIFCKSLTVGMEDAKWPVGFCLIRRVVHLVTDRFRGFHR